VIGGFRHKGLEEIHLTGETRWIGADHVRKCVRILQLLEVAARPEEMNIAGFRFHRLQGNPRRWSVRVTGNYRITFGGQAKTPWISILKTIIREEVMERKRGLPPVHPGEIIKQDILPSVGLSVTAAAKALGVSRQMLHDILAERKPLSAVMCLKVSRLFGGTPELWMQAAYDLKKAEQDKKVMARVARIVPVKPLEEVRA
jgi:addiction module HigA family antidote